MSRVGSFDGLKIHIVPQNNKTKSVVYKEIAYYRKNDAYVHVFPHGFIEFVFI